MCSFNKYKGCTPIDRTVSCKIFVSLMFYLTVNVDLAGTSDLCFLRSPCCQFFVNFQQTGHCEDPKKVEKERRKISRCSTHFTGSTCSNTRVSYW